ncbi:hypothetical protein [Streptomyces sp. NBC_01476]|uniref:hypothetical protein n=1 Tax=Streptomyces sp. NBC_01476 TaxID=2903881 RepID=UPI002E33E82B|nr:hypothetical protein [Streptomyces sp. NBC_01476]
MDHAPALPHRQLAALDERLAGAAARPVARPETIVVDRGKVFVSAAPTTAPLPMAYGEQHVTSGRFTGGLVPLIGPPHTQQCTYPSTSPAR